MQGDGGVRVRQIACLFETAPDGRGGLLLAAAISREVLLNAPQLARCNLVIARALQAQHVVPHVLGVTAGRIVQQALKVRRDQNVHRGRACFIELPAPVVEARLQKVRQHPVGVGCTDQSAHRQAQLLGVPACQDIAEVARRYDVIDLLPEPDLPLPQQCRIGQEVIDHLRRQPPDVNGVCRRQPDVRCRFPVREGRKHCLHRALTVVKVPFHRTDRDVLSLLGQHLHLLHLRDTLPGEKDDDPRPRHVVKALQGGLAGVARGRREDHGLLLHARDLSCCGHQLRQHAQCHVLKGRRRSVKELEHPLIPHRHQRCQLL